MNDLRWVHGLPVGNHLSNSYEYLLIIFSLCLTIELMRFRIMVLETTRIKKIWAKNKRQWPLLKLTILDGKTSKNFYSCSVLRINSLPVVK